VDISGRARFVKCILIKCDFVFKKSIDFHNNSALLFSQVRSRTVCKFPVGHLRAADVIERDAAKPQVGKLMFYHRNLRRVARMNHFSFQIFEKLSKSENKQQLILFCETI